MLAIILITTNIAIPLLVHLFIRPASQCKSRAGVANGHSFAKQIHFVYDQTGFELDN